MARYGWARPGDVNAFFGLMLDNAAVMVLLVGLLTTAMGPVAFTAEFVLTRMIPGTAVGVLLGDLLYTWMAFRLARRTGRDDVTAMPLGLDTPSTFGIPLLVLSPALQKGFELYKDHDQAMNFAWHVGVVVLGIAGVFKIAFAPLGNVLRRAFPRAGLLGSLAAIAIALIAYLPLQNDIAQVPLIGLPALVVILITLIAHRELPGRFPGALAAVLLGLALLLVGQKLGGIFGVPLVPESVKAVKPEAWHPAAWLAVYAGSSSWWSEVCLFALGKLPLALPFALATIIGGIDCTESAASAGDEYNTGSVLMTEGLAALVAAAFGGVLQTTPYIGHPAYKKMGGRAAYTLATALFVGAAGYFGWFTLVFDWLPEAAMYPILVFVGLEITAQSFHATPPKHYPALALAMLPALAYLIKILVTQIPFGDNLRPDTLKAIQTMYCLANGFLISGMLWAAALVMILDGRLKAAAGYFAVAGVFAFFGIIHSPLQNEQIGLPHHILEAWRERAPFFQDAVRYQTPYHWAGAYALVVLLCLGLSWGPSSQMSETTEPTPLPASEPVTGTTHS